MKNLTIPKSRLAVLEEERDMMRAKDSKRKALEERGDEVELIGEEAFEIISPLSTEWYPEIRQNYSVFSFLKSAISQLTL